MKNNCQINVDKKKRSVKANFFRENRQRKSLNLTWVEVLKEDKLM